MDTPRAKLTLLILWLGLAACSNDPAPTSGERGGSPATASGELGGRIAFPAEDVPAMTLVLLDLNSPEPIRVRSAARQTRYAVQVPPGRYVVFAIPDKRPDPLMIGAHTAYSACSARASRDGSGEQTCRTGPPREITVEAGSRVTDADIDDWYLEEQVASALLALADPVH